MNPKQALGIARKSEKEIERLSSALDKLRDRMKKLYRSLRTILGIESWPVQGGELDGTILRMVKDRLDERAGLQKALALINYHRGVLQGDGVNIKPAPGVMSALDRIENSIRCELEHGPQTSILLENSEWQQVSG